MDVIEVVPFATARVKELAEIHTVSGYEAYETARSMKRRKDFHLRRRTNAYNSRKFPARLRSKPKNLQIALEARCRKHRRRFSLREKKDRLPTHSWLVKRMKMEKMDGIYVPMHRLDKSISAALSAPSTICDVSHLALLELIGLKESILEALDDCIDENIADDVLNGKAEGRYTLYHVNAFPMHAIGPAKIMCHTNEKSTFQLWMWLHPSMKREVLSVLQELANSHFKAHERHLCRFEILGRNSGEAMSKVCRNRRKLHWELPLDQSISNSIQSWEFEDPRSKTNSKLLRTEPTLISPPGSTPPVTTCCPITNENLQSAEPSIEKLNAQFAAVLSWATKRSNYSSHFKVSRSPGSKGEKPFEASKNKVIESTLWQNTIPLEPFIKDHLTRSISVLPAFPCLTIQTKNGWDMILPPTYAPCVLKAFVFAGTTAIGLLEREALQISHGISNFPRDYPDTAAGQAFWLTHESRENDKYLARPKAKRVSYVSLQVESPFAPKWSQLFPNSEVNSFCVLRGTSYMEPFPFYNPLSKQSLTLIPVATSTLTQVRIELPRRGSIEPNAMICFPSEDDVNHFLSSQKWQGDMELTAKEAKRAEGYEMRSIMGFVTSSVDLDGKFKAIGFCHCEALQQIFIKQKSILPLPGLALVRNPSSRQYRPAILSVL